MQEAEGHFVDLNGETHTLEEVAAMLPPAEYPKEPVDFTFVKDPVRREAVVYKTRLALGLVCDFVKEVLFSKLTGRAEIDAKRNLGLPEEIEKTPTYKEIMLPIVADYALMMNVIDGETIVDRVIATDLEEHYSLGARYFKNYRYSWLYVEAVKGGVGCKCRNLMTGEEIFLSTIRKWGSTPTKGKTICVGIAPAGSVYILLGETGGAMFESPEDELRKMREDLGLPLEGPLVLSKADQARFAAATIRELYRRFGLAAFN